MACPAGGLLSCAYIPQRLDGRIAHHHCCHGSLTIVPAAVPYIVHCILGSGTVVGMKFGPNKAHAYVIMSSVAEAEAARDATWGLSWPPDNKASLRPKWGSARLPALFLASVGLVPCKLGQII